MEQGEQFWKKIPENPPVDLSEATQQLHHAAQFLAAIGHSFLSHRADDAHTNLAWRAELGLESRPFYLDQIYTLVLNYVSFYLELRDSNDAIVAVINLDQKNKSIIFRELTAEFKLRSTPELPTFEPIQHYKLPEHPIDQGTPFQKMSEESLRYLRLLRDNADVLITHANQRFDDASEMRIWPHHFDNGSICVLERAEQGEMTKTVGWGFSIPDETDEEHHFYINHWSNVKQMELDVLSNLPTGAYWTTEGKLMAILPIRALSIYQTAMEQIQLARAFFENGIKASRMIIQA